MATLSLVVITRNEERDLPGCLDSVPFADEVVIVDDGSTDDTLEVARRYTDRIFERRLDRFGRQKQFAIEQARSDWVLVLDADERLTPELASSVRAVLDADGPADGYKMRRLTWLYDRPVTFTGWYKCSHMRLFRRGHARYVDRRVHEFPELVGEGRVECLAGDLEHHTYEDAGEYRAKLDRYTRLAAEDWYDAGRRVTWATAPWFLLVVPVAAFLREFVVQGGWRGGATGWRIARMAARSDLRTAGHLRRLTQERA